MGNAANRAHQTDADVSALMDAFVDEALLERLCVASLAWMRENYPDGA